jgi:hypothetical protein
MTAETKTPAARWREQGDRDPHAGKYDCERHDLVHGNLTDDEIANAVFICDHRTSLESIALLTAAKDRIRWLSRQNEAKAAHISAIQNAANTVLHHWDAFGCLMVESPTAKTAIKKFRKAVGADGGNQQEQNKGFETFLEGIRGDIEAAISEAKHMETHDFESGPEDVIAPLDRALAEIEVKIRALQENTQ